MNDNADIAPRTTWIQLRKVLLELARREDDMALAEASAVPYWALHHRR